MILPENIYKEIISNIPILCADIILKNKNNNKFLLIKRNNEPLKNEWWIVGGRVHFFENLQSAIIRKTQEEVGIFLDNVKFYGLYEDFFDNNAFSNSKYHTLSVVFLSTISEKTMINLDEQSNDYKWSDSLPQRLENKIFKIN